MGQADILSVMQKSPKDQWTLREIADIIGVKKSCISRNMSQLQKYGFVHCIHKTNAFGARDRFVYVLLERGKKK